MIVSVVLACSVMLGGYLYGVSGLLNNFHSVLGIVLISIGVISLQFIWLHFPVKSRVLQDLLGYTISAIVLSIVFSFLIEVQKFQILKQLTIDGEASKAVVLEKKFVSYKGQGLLPYIAFRYQAGSRFYYQKKFISTLNVGDTIDIKYSKSNPNIYLLLNEF